MAAFMPIVGDGEDAEKKDECGHSADDLQVILKFLIRHYQDLRRGSLPFY
jgi:hypothetical protein